MKPLIIALLALFVTDLAYARSHKRIPKARHYGIPRGPASFDENANATVASRAVTVDSYDLAVEVNPLTRELSGHLSAELIARTELREIYFDAIGLNITNASSEFKVLSNQVQVTLPTTMHKGMRFTVTFDYTASGIFFVADSSFEKPIAYTAPTPQMARTWFPCLDDPSLKANRVTLKVKAPEGYVVVGDGEYTKPTATHQIGFAVAPFENSGRVFASAKVLSKAKKDAGRVKDALATFSTLWGEYPYPKFTTVILPDFMSMGANAGSVFLGENVATGTREFESQFVHAVAKQWWGGVVTPATWDDAWIAEGFAAFSEVLFYEKNDAVSTAHAKLLSARDRYFEMDPAGRFALAEPDRELNEQALSAMREKGTWVLQMLRRRIGDVVFFDALNRLQKDFRFGNISTEDVLSVFESASKEHLADFFDAWVYRAGYPDVSLKWALGTEGNITTHQLVLTVQQRASKVYQIPLDVLVQFRAGGATQEMRKTLQLHKSLESYSFELPENIDEVLSVRVDPELKLLAKISVERSASELAQLLSHPDVTVRQEAIATLATKSISPEILKTISSFIERERDAGFKEILRSFANRPESFEALANLLADSLVPPKVRISSALWLSDFGGISAAHELHQQFKQEKNTEVKEAIYDSLMRLGGAPNYREISVQGSPSVLRW